MRMMTAAQDPSKYSPQVHYLCFLSKLRENSYRFSKILIGLNSKMYIDPGLGDFGDRYYGTV